MKIETKYNKGDKVRIKADKLIKTTCPFCDGQGFKMIGETQLYCQNCDGEGVLVSRTTEPPEWVVGVIEGFNYEVRTDETYEAYFISPESDDYAGFGTYDLEHIQPLE